ncbi:lytic murein transglycosylase [Mesorhizobium sp. M8A.F.Ca.ET.207.01.1.1]|nr:lytic murein transglycosylase [Mesorhizobium sp. M8A.F.Ca.ET.207.01.1.1]
MPSPGAPLCPAGHLPHEGGDWQFGWPCLPFNVEKWRKRLIQPISPLVGEMPGRAEGGAS